MSSGNEILDMYIYETNTLLEQLENIILLLGSGIFCICVFSGETGIFRLLTALS